MLVNWYRSVFAESCKYIKTFDTEEKVDLYFTRPLGYLLARVADKINMTPNQVSGIRVLAAAIAAYCFAVSLTCVGIFFASCFLLLSSILDSSDGMLARMQNSASKYGHEVEGVSDTLSTFFIYLGIAWPLIVGEGMIWLWLALFAALCHGIQSSVLFFYHCEYRYFGDGVRGNANWSPTLKDARKKVGASDGVLMVVINYMLYLWALPQHYLTGRSDKARYKMKDVFDAQDVKGQQTYMERYRFYNLRMLSYWRLIGSMFHWLSLIVFAFLGWIKLYLLLDITLMNFLIFVFKAMQAKRDNQFLAELRRG